MGLQIKGIWSIESEVFINSVQIRPPDEIVEGISFDIDDRRLTEAQHPLKGRTKASGCYLYYCYYDLGTYIEPVYIYAGKADKFGKRLWTHWNDGERIDAFFKKYLNSGLLKKSFPLPDGTTVEQEPEPMVRVALWFVDEALERTMLEHGIIYAYRPKMNIG
jgi:hypothetical protein